MNENELPLTGLIDLHVHSTASDGSVPPGELPALAAAAGLAAVALTDHDTVDGVAEFLAAARHFPGLEAIAGVELSTRYQSRELHFVGLFVDPESAALADFLKRQRAEREIRAQKIMVKLASLGYPVTREELRAAGGGETPGRPHFARVLVEKYGFADMQTVFAKLLKHGAAAYVPRQLPEPAAAIEAIHAAAGLAVWAHPIYRQRNERAWARRMLKRFTALGLDAVEGYYSLFGVEETKLVTELAEIQGLALSGGSDFHGENTPNITLGAGAGKMRIPATLLDELKRRRPQP